MKRRLTMSIWTVLVLLLAQRVAAQMASDADMARSALEAALRSSNDLVLEQRQNDGPQALATRGLDIVQGNTEVLGNVVFSREVTGTEIQQLASDYGFEVTSVEAKIPIGQSGHVMTIGIGARDLIFLDDFEMRERLMYATGNQRYTLLQTASSPDVSASEREELLESLKNPEPDYYRVVVLASAKTLASLGELSFVAAVIAEETTDGAIAYRRLSEEISRGKGQGQATIRPGTLFENRIPRLVPGSEPPEAAPQ
jgi:hypothetical protein